MILSRSVNLNRLLSAAAAVVLYGAAAVDAPCYCHMP
jgi:hypothetical protein